VSVELVKLGELTGLRMLFPQTCAK